jgi:holo-[acyl-carrier protein] synthase
MIVGLGIDLVDIERVAQMLARHPERARRRLFTAREVEYAESRAGPAQHYAARLAAKEAAFKALAGTALARGIGWTDIEVASCGGSYPTLQLHGAAGVRARELGVRRALLSLTHSATAAAAVVVLETE